MKIKKKGSIAEAIKKKSKAHRQSNGTPESTKAIKKLAKGRKKTVNGSVRKVHFHTNDYLNSPKSLQIPALENSPSAFRSKVKKELNLSEDDMTANVLLSNDKQNRTDKKRKNPGSPLDNLDEDQKKKESKSSLNDNEPTEKFVHKDSRKEAKRSFAWLIYPVKPADFFREAWEKKPLLVKRHYDFTYYKRVFSTQEFDCILRENIVQFGKNIDVTSYSNGKRETHNPVGRAHPSVVWDYYQSGCSIRLLNPQTFSKSVWHLNSVLQEYLGSCVGSNVYLTPPGTQGFAPHYDDIEAFVLQLEGKKRWKVYAPRSPDEVLPRYSSDNLEPEELGENILNVELEAGDLLYFPRGFVHQASASCDTHSLHITVSAAQRNTWGDFFEKLLPRALEMMFEDDVEFRESLPIDYMEYMGIAHSDIPSKKRDDFNKKLLSLTRKLVNQLPIDACADQMAKKYIHDCLPPVITKAEKPLTVFAKTSIWNGGKILNQVSLEKDMKVRLFRANILRLVTEDNVVRVYHSMENSREYHGEELQYLEISPEMAPGVECLLHSYPEYIKVEDLPMENSDEKLTLIAALYEKGLLMSYEPLASLDEK